MDRFDGVPPSAALSMEFRILNWIGIIDQLSSQLAEKVLQPMGLPMSEFLMLNHFRHHPQDGKTIADVSRARQQLQPGATKTVQKLVAKRLLRTVPNKNDARSKLIFITADGQRAHDGAVDRLGPILKNAFVGIDDEQCHALFDQLDGIKRWFDDNRWEANDADRIRR